MSARDATKGTGATRGAGPPERPERLLLGHPRLHFRRTDSTNDRARELALAGAPHGTLVTAAEQSAGRGRQGRRWSAPAGSALLMSLLLRSEPAGLSPDSDQLPALLPLRAAVAVCDAVGARARVKWPNDVVFVGGNEGDGGGDRGGGACSPFAKLAGILTEGRPREGWAVLGIGINVAVRIEDLPQELHGSAATLGSSPRAIEALLDGVLTALGQRLSEPAERVLAAWRERDALRGHQITWEAGEGRAEGIDEAGRLLVVRADGTRAALDAGEVHLSPLRASLERARGRDPHA